MFLEIQQWLFRYLIWQMCVARKVPFHGAYWFTLVIFPGSVEVIEVRKIGAFQSPMVCPGHDISFEVRQLHSFAARPLFSRAWRQMMPWFKTVQISQTSSVIAPPNNPRTRRGYFSDQRPLAMLIKCNTEWHTLREAPQLQVLGNRVCLLRVQWQARCFT